MGKRAEAVAETRQRIIEAAADSYIDTGIGSTSMQEVARRADLAAGTVLYHFEDREQLSEAVINWIISQLQMPQASIFDNVDSVRDRIQILVSEIYSFYLRSERWVGMFFRERETIPALAQGEQLVMTDIQALIDAAFGSEIADMRDRAVVTAVIDPGHRGALMKAGLSASQAAETAVLELIRWFTGDNKGDTV